MKLIIVESPTKAKKIQGMLGQGYQVLASLGHIRDLPEKSMGVFPPDYKPVYELTKTGKAAMARIKEAAKKADSVFLASDPDREGEAIGWHLAQVLRLKKPLRVVYNEITENAIQKALASPRPLDMNLVYAQETRRVTDRLVGYRVSPILSSALNEAASSGRVQTPALFLIVRREREIKSFKAVKHYGCDFFFPEGWKASWDTKNWLSPDSKYILDRSLAEKVSGISSLKVRGFKQSESRQGPPPPFITSTLQRAGEKSLNITIKDVMSLAQKLFEGGNITYMRTDSPVLSQEAIAEIRAFCTSKSWPLMDTPRKWKSKESAQEAHEAIRPTHIEIEEAGETDQERALYRLIRVRTLATQLPDAVFAVRTVELQGPDIDGKATIITARGRTKVSPGWTALMTSAAEDERDENAENEASNPIPKLSEGQTVQPAKITVTDKQTSPPSRFSESSLVDDLEKRGIGRPATYAAILETLYTSKFAILTKKIITPTTLGDKIITALEGRFSFVDLDFTKRLEELLDGIAEGKQTYQQVITALDNRLDVELQNFMAPMNFEKCPRCGSFMRATKSGYICTSLRCSPDIPCPSCKKATRYGRSAKGVYMSCIDSPSCKGFYTFQDGKPVPVEKKG